MQRFRNIRALRDIKIPFGYDELMLKNKGFKNLPQIPAVIYKRPVMLVKAVALAYKCAAC